MNWIIANKEWLFSGIAIVVPIAILGWILCTRNIKQVQKSGKNSKNIQAGGNITFKRNGRDG